MTNHYRQYKDALNDFHDTHTIWWREVEAQGAWYDVPRFINRVESSRNNGWQLRIKREIDGYYSKYFGDGKEGDVSGALTRAIEHLLSVLKDGTISSDNAMMSRHRRPQSKRRRSHLFIGNTVCELQIRDHKREISILYRAYKDIKKYVSMRFYIGTTTHFSIQRFERAQEDAVAFERYNRECSEGGVPVDLGYRASGKEKKRLLAKEPYTPIPYSVLLEQIERRDPVPAAYNPRATVIRIRKDAVQLVLRSTNKTLTEYPNDTYGGRRHAKRVAERMAFHFDQREKTTQGRQGYLKEPYMRITTIKRRTVGRVPVLTLEVPGVFREDASLLKNDPKVQFRRFYRKRAELLPDSHNTSGMVKATKEFWQKYVAYIEQNKEDIAKEILEQTIEGGV